MEDNASARLLVGERPPNTPQNISIRQEMAVLHQKNAFGASFRLTCCSNSFKSSFLPWCFVKSPTPRHSRHPTLDLQTLCSWCSTRVYKERPIQKLGHVAKSPKTARRYADSCCIFPYSRSVLTSPFHFLLKCSIFVAGGFFSAAPCHQTAVFENRAHESKGLAMPHASHNTSRVSDQCSGYEVLHICLRMYFVSFSKA